MGSINISEIIEYLNKNNLEYMYCGDESLCICSYSSITNIENGNISWIKKIDEFDIETISNLKNTVIISGYPKNRQIKSNMNFIYCNNPKEVFFSIIGYFWKPQDYAAGISNTAVVETPTIGKGVHIGHNTYIGDEVIIGDNVIVKNNVSLEGKVVIGNNVIIHSGVVIGTDGYGLFKDKNGINHKVPHYGGVIIGNNVEIGANTCIAKGTLDNTIIGDNVKIDNLCHIGHNVIMHNNCCMVATAMLGGSSKIEDNAYIAPGAEVLNQITIGKNSIVGMGSVVIKSVPENTTVFGSPARVVSRNK